MKLRFVGDAWYVVFGDDVLTIAGRRSWETWRDAQYALASIGLRANPYSSQFHGLITLID